MSEERPARPIDAYKEIIDDFVTQITPGISERLVTEQGIFSKAPDNGVLNSFVHSLSSDQRRLLSQMLHRERISAISGVLATLDWWVVARDVGFTYRGELMQVQFAEGLLGDYIGRLHGWEWPDLDKSAAR